MEQAVTSIDGQTFGKTYVPDTFTEKFAELLIRECAAEADKQTIYCRGIPWGRWIREHFGVES
jgi:hypothetical protein